MSAAPRGGVAGSAALMFSGTAVSRVLGLLRNAVLALAITVNVAGAANAFSVANKLPNIIYMLVAGGVLNAVLVPQIVRAMRREDGGKDYVDRLLTITGAVLAVLTVILTASATLLVSLYGSRLGEWFDLSVAFAFWCVPQLFFYGLYTILGQVLNARSSFGPYMWAPALNNVIAIAGLGLFIALYGPAATSGGEDPAVWDAGRVALLAGTATLGVASQALILLVPLYRSGFRWTPRWGLRGTGLGTASRVAGWAFAALAVGQLGYLAVSNVAAAAATAGGGAADVAGNAAYDNAFLIYMLPQSLITVSLVTALFTRLSANAAAKDLGKVRGDLSLGLRVVGVFTVFATAALAVLALPIARVVLPTVTLPEAQSVANVTVAMLVGLSALGAWTLVQRVYYAFEDAKSLFWVQIPMAAIVAGGSLLGAVVLEPKWWVAGAGLAMSISTIVGALVAYLRLRTKLTTLDGRRVLGTHLRLVLAASVAALIGWGLLHLWGIGPGAGSRMVAVLVASLVRVAVIGTVMVAIYVAVLRWFRVDELDVLARPARRLIGGLGRRLRTMSRRSGGGTGAAGVTTPAPVAAPVSSSPDVSSAPEGGGGDVSDAGTQAPQIGQGTVLAGRYLLTEPLPTDVPSASGWRGRDRVLDRAVNALVLSGDTAEDALDAARRAALVDDPRLARVLSVGTHEGASFVVTEVVTGPSLAELVTAGPLEPSQARALIGEVASALEAARRRGVHHLALRPSAVHVTADSQVLVTGLGVDAAQLALSGGDYWAASRADAVGLVALLYVALTGRSPEVTVDDDGAHAGADVTPPGDLVPDLPNDLDTLCVVTLGANDDGPYSPAELIRELAPWGDLDLHPGTDAAASPGAAETQRLGVRAGIAGLVRPRIGRRGVDGAAATEPTPEPTTEPPTPEPASEAEPTPEPTAILPAQPSGEGSAQTPVLTTHAPAAAPDVEAPAAVGAAVEPMVEEPTPGASTSGQTAAVGAAAAGAGALGATAAGAGAAENWEDIVGPGSDARAARWSAPRTGWKTVAASVGAVAVTATLPEAVRGEPDAAAERQGSAAPEQPVTQVVSTAEPAPGPASPPQPAAEPQPAAALNPAAVQSPGVVEPEASPAVPDTSGWAPAWPSAVDDAGRPAFESMLATDGSATRVPGHVRRPGEAPPPAQPTTPASGASGSGGGKATVAGAAAAGATVLGRVGAAGKQGLAKVGDASKGAAAKPGNGAKAGTAATAEAAALSTGTAAADVVEPAPPAPRPASASTPATADLDVPDLAWNLDEAEDLAPSAPAPRAPRPQRAFDPTPYVLAIMLAAVLFGLIAAVNNLLGARTARTEDAPAQSPAVTQTIGEPHPEIAPGAVVVLTAARA